MIPSGWGDAFSSLRRSPVTPPLLQCRIWGPPHRGLNRGVVINNSDLQEQRDGDQLEKIKSPNNLFGIGGILRNVQGNISCYDPSFVNAG